MAIPIQKAFNVISVLDPVPQLMFSMHAWQNTWLTDSESPVVYIQSPAYPVTITLVHGPAGGGSYVMEAYAANQLVSSQTIAQGSWVAIENEAINILRILPE